MRTKAEIEDRIREIEEWKEDNENRLAWEEINKTDSQIGELYWVLESSDNNRPIKAMEIIRSVNAGIPAPMIISYIISNGTDMVKGITDEQIESLEGNPMMTAEFVKDLVRASREVAKNCSQNEIVQLIQAEWACF